MAALLAGCESPVRLMPTSVGFRSGEGDSFAQAGTTALGTDVPVLYATNRGAVVETPAPIHTILSSERLRMGVTSACGSSLWWARGNRGATAPAN